MKLTAEQKTTIENSLWVVNTVLKAQGLQGDSDLRQNAILYMCQCLLRFDPTKNIKWTTYAYKSLFYYTHRVHAKEAMEQSKLLGEETIYIVEADDREFAEALAGIKSLLSPEENNVLDLKGQGYKRSEISQILGCSPSKVNNLIKAIKAKAKR